MTIGSAMALNAWQRSSLAARLVVGGAIAILVTSFVWGRQVQTDARVKLGAAPLVGQWRIRFTVGTVISIAFGVLAIFVLPKLLDRVRWRGALALTAFAATAFTFALAASDGLNDLLDPVVHRTEYWANLRTLPPPRQMLRSYGSIDFLLKYSVHAKGHPPGFLLLLQVMDGIGLGRPGFVGALSYLGAAALPVGVLSTVRSVADEASARRVAPFLVVAPYAVWMGTSADALYTACCAVGVACVAAALTTTRPPVRWSLGLASGLLLGCGLFFSYGIATLLVLPALVLLRRIRVSPRAVGEVAVGAAAGAGFVTAAFALAGFWWFTGLNVTRTFYWWGTAQFRPGPYFFIGNLGCMLIAVGPAAVAGWASRLPRAIWWTAGGGFAGLMAANVSQYSKGEVERIWLLFFPWILTAVAGLDLQHRRSWLGAQAALAIGLQTALVSKW